MQYDTALSVPLCVVQYDTALSVPLCGWFGIGVAGSALKPSDSSSLRVTLTGRGFVFLPVSLFMASQH
jgi:hypothetical protein